MMVVEFLEGVSGLFDCLSTRFQKCCTTVLLYDLLLSSQEYDEEPCYLLIM